MKASVFAECGEKDKFAFKLKSYDKKKAGPCA